METNVREEIIINDKITASCPTNIPQAVYQTKINELKLLG